MALIDRLKKFAKRAREFILPQREEIIPKVVKEPPPPEKLAIPPRTDQLSTDLKERIEGYVPESQHWTRYGLLPEVATELTDKFTHGDESKARMWTQRYYRDKIDDFLERRKAADWITIHTDQLHPSQLEKLAKERLPVKGSYSVVFTAKGESLEKFTDIKKAKSRIQFLREETTGTVIITWTTRGRYESFAKRKYHYDSPVRDDSNIKEINKDIKKGYLYPDQREVPVIGRPAPAIPKKPKPVAPIVPQPPLPPVDEEAVQTKGADYDIFDTDFPDIEDFEDFEDIELIGMPEEY